MVAKLQNKKVRILAALSPQLLRNLIESTDITNYWLGPFLHTERMGGDPKKASDCPLGYSLVAALLPPVPTTEIMLLKPVTNNQDVLTRQSERCSVASIMRLIIFSPQALGFVFASGRGGAKKSGPAPHRDVRDPALHPGHR